MTPRHLDDGIDSERRIQLRELRRIGKHKNKGPDKYYFYLGQQFSSKEIVTGRVRMHSLETRRKLIMVKNDKEWVRVRCEGIIPALVPYVTIETDMGKNEFLQTKGGPVIRDNINNGKQNILGKDKTCQGKGKKVNKQKKVDKYSCPWNMLAVYTNEGRWEVRTLIEDHNCLQSREIKACTSRFLSDHIIKSLATNPDIPMTAVQDQMQKQFDVGGPWPGQILTAVGVDANNKIYPVAYAIVEAESKASWCWFLNLLGEDLGLIQAIASVFLSTKHKYCVRHIHENMKSQFKGGVYREMLWNAAKTTSVGEFNKKMAELKLFNSAAYDCRAKCDLLLNNIREVFNRQLVDGGDQPIITCLEYIKEYLMKRIVVVQKVIAKIVGPLTPSVIKLFDAIKKRLLIGRPPKKRKKPHDEIANESCSSGKLSRKGKSMRCGKYENVAHNRKGYRGQGGATQAGGFSARNVSGRGGARRTVGARNVSGQEIA
ncbi:mutator type transposase [Tanacetum coccineum]